MDRKEKLIEALKTERERFDKNGLNLKEHDVVIDFLIKGITTYNSDEYDLLYSAIYDLETLYSDYGC